MSADTKIERIEAYSCSLPLESPINLGTLTVKARIYTIIRINIGGGVVGLSASQTRGAPVDTIVLDLLAPILIGTNALDLAARQADMARATVVPEQHGLVGRARSLLEIALQDIRSKVMGRPLWSVLGGGSKPVEVMLVEGYPIPNETRNDYVDRLLARVDQGFKRLKMEIGSFADPSDLVSILKSFRVQAPDTALVLDGVWRWKTISDALQFITRLREYNIDWIEDPFPPVLVSAYRRLAKAHIACIGAGDEITNPNDIEALLDAGIDILRLDAAAIGGITAFGELAARASKLGVRVSPHVHAEIHQHCAFGWGILDHIEMIPPDRPFDCFHRLLQNDLYSTVKAGLLEPPDRPGVGFDFDDDAVERSASRKGAVGR